MCEWLKVANGIPLFELDFGQTVLRLAYFFGTSPKVRVLENVSTGEIGGLTEQALRDEYHIRKVITNPSETWNGLAVFSL